MPRTMIGVLETYQQADGSIRVPKCSSLDGRAGRDHGRLI
jgi:hypothetical protein